MPPSDSAVASAEPAAAASPAAVAPAASAAPGAEQQAAAPVVSADAPAPLPTVADTLLDPAKPAEAEPAKPAEPIDPASYELTLPDGVKRDDPLVAAFLESAAGSRLENAAVQAVLDKAAPIIAEQMRAPYQAWVDLNKQWQADVKADAEIGGQNFEKTISTVTGLIDRFGTPALKDALLTTGAGNHPEMIRFLAKIGAAYVEAGPGPAVGSSPPQPAARERGLQALYPSAAPAAAPTAA
jgi:hypothetical protein